MGNLDYCGQDIIKILNKNFQKITGKAPPSNSNIDIDSNKNSCVIDNYKARVILNFPLRYLEETVTDTVVQILKIKK